MCIDNKITVKPGDSITIQAQNINVSGVVISAHYYGTVDGWYIEIGNANVPGNYSYWKQRYDGGKIIMLNGKPVR